jgi:hypothetical protein
MFLGIYVSGARPSHPFKVIEQEPDRRSVCSETRSTRPTTMQMKQPANISYEPSSRGDSVPRALEVSKILFHIY